VQELARAVLAHRRLFGELSPNLMDLPSLRGFAARWGVLDLLFALIEAGKVEGSERERIYGPL
jgi:hypothetical protein